MIRLVTLISLAASFALAQPSPRPDAPRTEQSPEAPRPDSAPESKEPETESGGAPEAPAPAASRTALNLLGETDSKSGESRRNENVQFNLIDNNALKELNQRIGITPTPATEFTPERNYFGSEFGTAPSTPIIVQPRNANGWHGRLSWGHLNSVTNARSFFQVGGVKPARENRLGASVTGRLWRNAHLSFDGGLDSVRGMVNGNILVPLPNERTPLATEPAARAFVTRVLAAFPAELPNRTDIDPRMLNTNAPQRINNRNAITRLDQTVGSKDRFIASHTWITQQVEAFQFVKGQNPDTTTRSHQAGLQWHRAWSPSNVTVAAVRFDRTGSVIVPERNNIGPAIFVSGVLTTINGNNSLPIDRAQNIWRSAFQWKRVAGRRQTSMGFELARRQMNGRESDAHLGAMDFFNNFGVDAMTAFRSGLPTRYFIASGNIHRGYRNWDNWFYLAERWTLSPALTLSYGIGYRPVSRPREVNNLDSLPYYTDANNVGPNVGLAYRLPKRWGVWRAAYGIHFGEVFPVTFQQTRFNAPRNYKVVIQNPELTRIVTGGYALTTPPSRSVFYDYTPDLVSPYSQQYTAQWELEPAAGWAWQLSYVGSRSVKLLNHWYMNRAHPRAGVPLTTATIDERRALPQYVEIRRVMNSSRGYFDAFRTSLLAPNWHGLNLDASYWFSKAIDLGGDYTNTAQDMDSFRSRSQNEFNVLTDLKGRSRFDSPHAVLVKANYRVPRLKGAWGMWSIDSAALAKSGTPFSLQTGSDAPGFGNVDGISGDRPVLLDPSILGRTISHPDVSRSLMPRSAFAFIPPGQEQGSLGRNVFRRASVRNWNGGLTGRWQLRDTALQFRAEAINLTNTPQFAEPNFNLTDPNFAVITNTLNDGRAFRMQMQWQF